MSLIASPLGPGHEQRRPRPPDSAMASRAEDGGLPTTVSSPCARITRRRMGQRAGVVFTVAGEVGAHDAAVLSRCLHVELDDRGASGSGAGVRVIVVDLSDVVSFGSELVDLLTVAEERARTLSVGLHLLEIGGSGLRQQLETRRRD